MAAMKMASGQMVATTTVISAATKKPMMFFGGHGAGFPNPLRVVAAVTASAMAWLGGPVNAFSKGPAPIKPYSRLTEKGLTQTPNAALQGKIAAKEAAVQAAKNIDMRPLSGKEAENVRGRGPYRNAYFNGNLPWQRSFHDVNMCNGNLFKSFTDIQIAPGRGAGLVLQRTYNSNDDRIGPFGVGWTHAYDIRMEEAGTNPTDTEPGTDPGTDTEVVPRTDFFGGKHDYKRDADGLYSPPAYMFDEMDSKYDEALANGPSQPLEDIQKGMDGTVKHFITSETLPDSSVNHNVRVCDYIEDRHGNRTNLVYNLTVTLPDGSTKKLLTSVTDPTGRSLTFTWANLGTTSQPAYRITQVDGPSGTYSVTYAYNTDLNLSGVTLDSTGLARTITYGYTSCAGETGLLSSITDALGHVVSYAYSDLPGDPDTDPNSNPTGTVWVTQVTEPAGVSPTTSSPRTISWNLTTEREYYGFSTYVTEASGTGLRARLGFDDYGRFIDLICGEVGFGSHLVSYGAYDTANNVVQTTETSMEPSAPDAELITHSMVSTYGPHGNVLTQQIKDFTGTTTTHYWDASKYFQQKSVTDAMGNESDFDYYDDQDTSVGNRGEAKWVRDARYNTTSKQFEYTYNQYGQKTSEKNLNDVVTAYTYGDTWGNLTQVVQDPSNVTTSYTGLARTTSMTYDVFGRVLSSVDPMGHTNTFSYNKLGQPTVASSPATYSGSTLVTPAESYYYYYGANGRTTSVVDGRGTTSLAYEADSDRVASVTDPVTGTISYTYGLTGERSSVTFPNSATWTYSYAPSSASSGYDVVLPKDDPNSLSHRLVRITDENGRRVDVTMSSLGSLYQVKYNQTLDSGGNVTASCDSSYAKQKKAGFLTTAYRPTSDRLAQIKTTYTNASTTARLLSQNNYTYDNNSRRTSNVISTEDASSNLTSRTETYGYNALSRLTSVNYGDSGTANVQTYSFDAMGNRTAKTDNVTGSESYGFNNANMLTSRSVGGSSGTYSNDANGNTLSGGGRVNTWDSQNRLVKVVKGGVTSEFTYGCDGLRRRSLVTKANGEQTRTDFVIEGQSVVQEIVQQRASSTAMWGTASTVSYLQGPSGPLYRHVSGTTDVSWYVYDGLGSIVGEVDVTGNLTSTKDHDVYGLTRSVTGTPMSRHGFVGGLGHTEDDETGYLYMRARHYDPETGRFASQDPVLHGDNWFVYCNNDPVNKMDSSGRAGETCEELIAIVMAIYENGSKKLDGWDPEQAIFVLRSAIRKFKNMATMAEQLGEGEVEVGNATIEGGTWTGPYGATILARLGEIQVAVGDKTISESVGARLAAREVEIAIELLTQQL